MKTILLVEDDQFIVDIYANEFKKAGFAVDVARDGEMALEKIKDRHPDLLVLDILLPKMTGWDLLKIIRSDAVIKNVKVIVISNLDRDDYARNIADLGVIRYFLKIETTPEEIASAIKEI